jgi:hypothetical protein
VLMCDQNNKNFVAAKKYFSHVKNDHYRNKRPGCICGLHACCVCVLKVKVKLSL